MVIFSFAFYGLLILFVGPLVGECDSGVLQGISLEGGYSISDVVSL